MPERNMTCLVAKRSNPKPAVKVEPEGNWRACYRAVAGEPGSFQPAHFMTNQPGSASASLHDWERTAADLIEVEAATRAKLREWQTVAARLAEELDDYQLRMNPSVREALAKYEILKGTAI